MRPLLTDPAPSGAWFSQLVHRHDLVGHGVAYHVEPLAAAVAVAPALGVAALRIRAEEQVLRPFLVAALPRRPRDVRFAAVAEFRLVADSAPGTFDPEHVLSFRRVRRCNAIHSWPSPGTRSTVINGRARSVPPSCNPATTPS